MNHSCENTSLQNVSVENLQFSRYGKFMEIHVLVPESEYMIQNPNLET